MKKKKKSPSNLEIIYLLGGIVISDFINNVGKKLEEIGLIRKSQDSDDRKF